MRWESGFSFEVMWSAISGLSWDGACSRREVGALEIVAAVSELRMERRGALYGKICCLNSCSWIVRRKERMIGQNFYCKKCRELGIWKVD
jgi:hypothetical protein